MLTAKILRAAIVKKFVPPRRTNSRKGDNGTALVVGGSYIYHGAPILSSIAALRCGSDLVYTAVPKINVQATRSLSPNLIVIPLADQKLTKGAARKLIGQIPKDLDSATIGMGLSVHEIGALKFLVKSLVDRDVRLSLDAGALVSDILPEISGKNSVITPHAGEFRRLFGTTPPDSIASRATVVQRLAKSHKITILLKGTTDVISDGSTTYLNPKKLPAMTVGGTGDVLSGLVVGMLAKNRNPLESAATAAFFNGLAGKAIQKSIGLHAVPMDLCDVLPFVIKPFDRIKS